MDQSQKAQAEQELEGVLQKWAHVFGPRACDCMDENPETPPEGGWVIGGWVLAVDWGSVETADTWTSIISPDNLPRSQKIGLSSMAAHTYI